MFPDELPVSVAVLRIATALEESGYETWCVGGAVRDNLLGLANHDFDLTTSAPPTEVQRIFRRTVPIGIEHGTVAVQLDNESHEVTTFRRDAETDGRHAVVEFGVSLHDDLARRDFTINAMAYRPTTQEWCDPFGGRHDLERKILRAVGDPRLRFQEDYLRILRALRFSARFDFVIEEGTWIAAKATVDGLRQLSAERVRDEWFKGLQTTSKVSRLIALWNDVGALAEWLPEIDQEKWVDDLPRDPVLLTAYLARDPESLLTRLKCANREIARGRAIALWKSSMYRTDDPAHIRRWLASTGEYVTDLLILAPPGIRDTIEAVRATNPPLTLKQLAINGHALMDLHMSGPSIGKMLNALLDRVLEDPTLNTQDALLTIAKELNASSDDHSRQS